MSDEPITGFRSPFRAEYVVHAGATTAAFLRGILEGKLLGRRCPVCLMVYVPPRSSCPTCAVPCDEVVEVLDRGTVTTFSVIRFPFAGQVLEPPYAAAHILLDGTDTPLLHIVGDVDVDSIRMGMRVGAVWQDPPVPSMASIRYFEPIDEPDAPYESFSEHV